MQITIITVSYNSEGTISRTVESVLAQAYPRLEYIIVDGASQDRTVEVARNYREAFRSRGVPFRIISEPDKGMYDAMNKGIAAASGDIVGILNSDDRYVDGHVLQSVAEAFVGDAGLDTCYGDLLYVKGAAPHRYWRSGRPRSFRLGWMPPHPAFFVRADVYERYGVFRLDCGVNADYELMLRLLERHRVSSRWIDRPLVYMEAGGVSNRGIRSRMEGLHNDSLAWRKNGMSPPPLCLFLKRLRKLPQFMHAQCIGQVLQG